jgi:quercetin dioxygenase-like cupin family protein
MTYSTGVIAGELEKVYDLPVNEWLETEGGICVRMVKIELAGEFVQQHAHDFGHTTLIAHGKVRFFIGDQYVKNLEAPALQYVEANVVHTYQALVDNVVLACISKQET